MTKPYEDVNRPNLYAIHVLAGVIEPHLDINDPEIPNLIKYAYCASWLNLSSDIVWC